MMNLIDMHMHSIYSDGEYEVSDLINIAKKNNITTLSLTDHDTLLGNKEIRKYKFDGINIINGIELSAKIDKGRMHILGYDFNLDDKNLNNKMDELKLNSIYSTMALINQIRIDYNIILNIEDIKTMINKKGNINRVMIAEMLIKYNFAKKVKEAFDNYLNPSYDKIRSTNRGITYKECINLIKQAGGIAVLAHPNQLLMDDYDLELTIRNLVNCGLDGIEVYHSGHSKAEIAKYLNIANKYNLLISGGSDFHGPNVKPNVKIGYGINNNLQIKKLSLVDYINKRSI